MKNNNHIITIKSHNSTLYSLTKLKLYLHIHETPQSSNTIEKHHIKVDGHSISLMAKERNERHETAKDCSCLNTVEVISQKCETLSIIYAPFIKTDLIIISAMQ